MLFEWDVVLKFLVVFAKNLQLVFAEWNLFPPNITFLFGSDILLCTGEMPSYINCWAMLFDL